MTITQSHRMTRQDFAAHGEAVGRLAEAAEESSLRGAAAVEVTIAGTRAELPPEVVDALGHVLKTLADGNAVAIGTVDDDVTTGAAAKMLGISRTYLCTLVDRGELPCHYVGTHRRIKLQDVLAYANKRQASRREALDELSRISADAGLYDDDF